jgi:hypothetical protein
VQFLIQPDKVYSKEEVMGKRFVRSKSPSCEGGLVEYLSCSFEELRKVFGEPDPGCDNEKISTEWTVLDTQTGKKFVIYDWKETNLYDDELHSVEEFRALPNHVWHIGGIISKPDVDALVQFLIESNKR